MTKEQYHEYLKTPEWRIVANAVKKRAGYKCQTCNSPLDLIAHHRNYEYIGREAMRPDDLTCLCKRCHNLFHDIKPPEPPKERMFNGRMVPVLKYDEAKVDAWLSVCHLIDHEAVGRDMPLAHTDTVVLTRELLERCRTSKGGFSGPTVRALGLSFPLPNGWLRKLRGTSILRKDFKSALEGRYLTGAPRGCR